MKFTLLILAFAAFASDSSLASVRYLTVVYPHYSSTSDQSPLLLRAVPEWAPMLRCRLATAIQDGERRVVPMEPLQIHQTHRSWLTCSIRPQSPPEVEAWEE
ncbi:hypothetical protein BDK51DRAFT_34593 [Blyttiomyces helicus]|uniref:Secreted protein n=1 Tax=Blyttiomyces helicus TaxID=388810 RepID=A0A4P9WH43_9FUNG|nr:hypothetical protein BDK51DRAFT_34593 [Blyttiomyces helicus]|eukprot:RKO91163.1 hypothetical protein BDK51DRAFT_34593 [Blyttiomyces helicus]